MGRSRFLHPRASNTEEHPEAHYMLVERSSGYVKKSAVAECKKIYYVTHTKQTRIVKDYLQDSIFNDVEFQLDLYLQAFALLHALCSRVDLDHSLLSDSMALSFDEF
ncbi:hypothetical protein CEXT_129061 [Caerostris extrusa]|uniref:Protein kinase domain-containing protein n=1 Tax=Caerostris extrusa TaxID=172846 RepID=A0AAV4NVS2_CAEEX|nr:hypothetical protein CEXT_129061 [Caerostris extrusa]